MRMGYNALYNYWRRRECFPFRATTKHKKAACCESTPTPPMAVEQQSALLRRMNMFDPATPPSTSADPPLLNGPAVAVDPRIQRTPYLQPAGGVSGCARQTVLFISFLLSGSEPACAPPEVRAAPALAQLNRLSPGFLSSICFRTRPPCDAGARHRSPKAFGRL